MSPRDIPQLRPFFLLFLLSLLSSRNKEQLTSENSNLIVSVVVKNTPELTIFDDNIDNGDNNGCG